MERAANMEPIGWPSPVLTGKGHARSRIFAGTLVGSACLSALLASWVPLQFSIVAVFLFAGPHNWFEFRYFLMRLPARFGRSRNFFLVAFAGIGFLTLTSLSLPGLYYTQLWSGNNWIAVIGVWNTLLLLWIATLVWLRGKQSRSRKWTRVGTAAWPVVFALSSLNWLAPEIFSLAIVYLHPLVALWFLDRHLRRTRPEWLATYHRFLALLPLLIGAICWQLARTPHLADDNGLAWRITQHAGAELLTSISSHLLVSLHVFLEMLHYGVWLVALPLIGASGPIWDVKTIPLFGHPRGFPRSIVALLVLGLFLIALLWLGFAVDYSVTRDVYFAVAIAHVLAEVPFLLRTI
ncbi:MAG: hypothetical protein ACREBG_02380 [Pyrinomonadaceae bacterium]